MERADFRTRELLANYSETVLDAVREVDTAVDAYLAQQERLGYLADALTAARRAVTLRHRPLRSGVDGLLKRHRRAAAGIRN